MTYTRRAVNKHKHGIRQQSCMLLHNGSENRTKYRVLVVAAADAWVEAAAAEGGGIFEAIPASQAVVAERVT